MTDDCTHNHRFDYAIAKIWMLYLKGSNKANVPVLARLKANSETKIILINRKW